MKDVQLESAGPPGIMVGAGPGWRAVVETLRGVTFDLANVLFPSDCCVCGGPVLHVSRTPVCDACVESVKPQAEHERQCVRCGEVRAVDSVRFAAECSMCRMAPPAFERAVSYAAYDTEVREMLHLLKFSRLRSVASSLMGRGMAEAVRKLRGQAADALVVVPVPLFPAREWARGFNQAALLAQAALAELRRSERAWTLTLREDLLRRVKDTPASYALNPSQRRKGLAGAFRVVDAEAVRGREVLLIDDILTTGATARECSRVLRRAGATKVWVATFARAQEEALEMETSVARWDAPAAGTVMIEPDAAKRQRFVQ